MGKAANVPTGAGAGEWSHATLAASPARAHRGRVPVLRRVLRAEQPARNRDERTPTDSPHGDRRLLRDHRIERSRGARGSYRDVTATGRELPREGRDQADTEVGEV